MGPPVDERAAERPRLILAEARGGRVGWPDAWKGGGQWSNPPDADPASPGASAASPGTAGPHRGPHPGGPAPRRLGALDAATLHDRVPRNVTVAGVDIGSRGRAGTDTAIARAAAAYSRTRIEFVIGGKVTSLRAADVGLHLDPAATLAAAKAVGRHDNPVARPVLWAAAFFRPRARPGPHQRRHDPAGQRPGGPCPGQVPVHEATVVGSPYGVGISEGRTGRGFRRPRSPASSNRRPRWASCPSASG